MATWVCTECTTTYSVGAPRCPHCGSTEHVEQGEEAMPKITRHGGPTIAGAAVVGGSWSSEGDPDVWPEPPADEGGGEESSPGSSSSASETKPSSEPEPSEKPTPSRARTTGSRSKKGATDKASSARSTGGGQEDGTSDSDEAAS